MIIKNEYATHCPMLFNLFVFMKFFICVQTHSFLLKGDPPPECTTCECQLTIQHILVDCIEYDFIRPELFGNNTRLKDIFDNVSSDDIIMFIKRAHLFNEL